MHSLCALFFFFNDTATTEIYTLSLQRRSSDLTSPSPKTSGTSPTPSTIASSRKPRGWPRRPRRTRTHSRSDQGILLRAEGSESDLHAVEARQDLHPPVAASDLLESAGLGEEGGDLLAVGGGLVVGPAHAFAPPHPTDLPAAHVAREPPLVP